MGREMSVPVWPWYHPIPNLPAMEADVAETFFALAAKDQLTLPLPGGGATLGRFVALAEISAVDLSLGRLVEGHTDAVAILAEAGREPPPGAVLGVWAARRGADVVATPVGEGWRLRGRKSWASGAGTLTHALMTAAGPDGDRLFEVAMDQDGVTVVPGTWPAVGMAMSDSADVEFDILVGRDAAVGPPGWYVDRPGFWFGSVGVAACWLGGALGLVRALRTDLAERHLGAAATRCASLAREIAWAAGRIDSKPSEVRALALEVRHLVEDGCLEVMAHVGRAGGAGPLCHDRAQSRRLADLPVYIRQHHTDRDAEALGRLLLTGSGEP
jgi:alkylation response protein AidB-like acyl-CoA dehydrogenase